MAWRMGTPWFALPVAEAGLGGPVLVSKLSSTAGLTTGQGCQQSTSEGGRLCCSLCISHIGFHVQAGSPQPARASRLAGPAVARLGAALGSPGTFQIRLESGPGKEPHSGTTTATIEFELSVSKDCRDSCDPMVPALRGAGEENETNVALVERFGHMMGSAEMSKFTSGHLGQDGNGSPLAHESSAQAVAERPSATHCQYVNGNGPGRSGRTSGGQTLSGEEQPEGEPGHREALSSNGASAQRHASEGGTEPDWPKSPESTEIERLSAGFSGIHADQNGGQSERSGCSSYERENSRTGGVAAWEARQDHAAGFLGGRDEKGSALVSEESLTRDALWMRDESLDRDAAQVSKAGPAGALPSALAGCQEESDEAEGKTCRTCVLDWASSFASVADLLGQELGLENWEVGKDEVDRGTAEIGGESRVGEVGEAEPEAQKQRRRLRTPDELQRRIEMEEQTRRRGTKRDTPLVRALTWGLRGVETAEEVGGLWWGREVRLEVCSSVIQKLGIEGQVSAALALFHWLEQRAAGNGRELGGGQVWGAESNGARAKSHTEEGERLEPEGHSGLSDEQELTGGKCQEDRGANGAVAGEELEAEGDVVEPSLAKRASPGGRSALAEDGSRQAWGEPGGGAKVVQTSGELHLAEAGGSLGLAEVAHSSAWAESGAQTLRGRGATEAGGKAPSRNLPPNVYIYNSLLGALKTNGEFALAGRVVRWMQEAGVTPDAVTFNTLISLAEKMGKPGGAFRLFQAMRASGVQPTLFTFRNLIGLCRQQGQLEQALALFEELGRADLPLTSMRERAQHRETAGMLRAWCHEEMRRIRRDAAGQGDVASAGDAEHARDVADAAGGGGGGRGDVAAAEEGLPGRDADGSRSASDDAAEAAAQGGVASAEDVVRGQACGGGDVGDAGVAAGASARAVELFVRMREAGVRPKEESFRQALLACCQDPEALQGAARSLLREMRAQGLQPDPALCSAVIAALGRAKKWWAALEVYEVMLAEGPPPTQQTRRELHALFGRLLTAARERRLWKFSLQVLANMEGAGLAPDPQAWRTALVTCATANQTEAAVRCFQQMIERGHRPHVVEYGALLSALEKGNLLEKVLEVWEHMRRVGIRPNRQAYTTLIAAYGKGGEYGQAAGAFLELQSSGCGVDVAAYNAMLTACASSGQAMRARDWLEQMRQAWVEPNEVSYQLVIEALGNEGLWQEALELYVKMRAEGRQPTHTAYDSLIRVCEANEVRLDHGLIGPRPYENTNGIVGPRCKVALPVSTRHVDLQ